METPKLSDVKFKDDLLSFNYKILQNFAKVNCLPSNLKKCHLAELIAAHNSGNKDLVAEKIDFVMKERCLNNKPGSKKKILPTRELINKYLNKTHSNKHCDARKSLIKRFNSKETRAERTNNINIIQTRSMNKIKKGVSHLNETEIDVRKHPKITTNTCHIQVKRTSNAQPKYYTKVTNKNDELKKKEAYLREINLIDRKASVVPNIKTKNIINSTIDLSYKKLTANKMTNLMDIPLKTYPAKKPVLNIPKRSIFHTTSLPVNKKIIIKKQSNNLKTKFTPKRTSSPKVEKPKKQSNAIDRITDIDTHLHSLIMEFCTQNTEEMKDEYKDDNKNYANDSNYIKEEKEPVYVRRMVQQTLPSMDVAFGNIKEKTPEYMKPLYVHVSTESERYDDIKYYFPIYSNTGDFLLKMSEDKDFGPLSRMATSSNLPLTTSYVTNYYLPTSGADTSNLLYDSDYVNQQCIPDEYDMVSENLFAAYESEYLEEMGTYKNELKSCEYFNTTESWRHDSAVINGTSEVFSLDQASYSNIAPMIEDALYIASMDVKYMESSGMNIHMQCVKCRWAGPRLLLEHHIRLEHDKLIYKSADFSWMLAVNVASVVRADDGLSELLECFEGSIFVVHFKYRSTKLMISLFSLVEEGKSVCASFSIYPKSVGPSINCHQIVCMLPPVQNYAHRYCSFDLAELNYLPRSTVEYNYCNYATSEIGASWCNVDVPLFISVTFD